MSSVGAVGNPYGILQQSLFNQIDSSGSGAISKSELEQAVTSAGGSTQGADALYAQLDPNNTGSVNEQQFSQNLPPPPFGPLMGAQMIGVQADASSGSSGTGPGDQLAQALFSQIDTNGDGSINKSELEQAVTAVGGTTQAADALYAQLDPNNTGSVNEQQLAQYLQPSSPAGNTAQDALLALIQSQQPTTSISGNSAQDALSALIQNFTSNPSSAITGNSTQGNSAQDALWMLQNFDSAQTGDGSSGLDPLLSLLSGGTDGGSDSDPLLALLNGSSDGSSDSDPLMSLLNASTDGGSSGLGTGNTAQDALFALMQAGSANASNGNSGSSTTGTTSSADLAMALSLYQSQMTQQMFGSMFGSTGLGF